MVKVSRIEQKSIAEELGILPAVPEAKSIYSDKFVPVQF